MRLLLTGLNGTLAPGEAEAATGCEVLGWDRQRVPPADAAVAAHWPVHEARPDAIAHLATGDEHWAASRAWIPACSFMTDTAAAIVALLRRPQPRVWHLDANAGEAHASAAIVRALQRRFAREAWREREHADHRHDQRLVAGWPLPPLSDRLRF